MLISRTTDVEPVNANIRLSAAAERQVCWQQPSVVRAGVNQSHLAISDAPSSRQSAFSFLVLGDTDAGLWGDHSSRDGVAAQSFSQQFAKQVLAHSREHRFLLHTGDVAYPAGSYENYLTTFLRPYQDLLKRLPKHAFYRSDDVVFNRPLLAVPGNHDYADDRGMRKLWQQLLRKACDRLRQSLNIDLGHYGGQGGEAYGQTFLDDLAKLSPEQLSRHLALHYTAKVDSLSDDVCLNYQPGTFTRLPNRYYSFRYGGIDFFALDSNTWKTDAMAPGFDQAQLDWLEHSLMRSWNNPETMGRIIYMHHSPYTTESYHWQRPETLWVRRHLRMVLDKVTRSGVAPAGLPLVDLVISGHAHCLEHLKTTAIDHGDAAIDWVVCGGSGADVRRQRGGDDSILENVVCQGRMRTQMVAKSQFYAGRHGHSYKQQNFHSFIRVDVQPERAQKITVCPFVVTPVNSSVYSSVYSTAGNRWQTKAIAPLSIGSLSISPEKTQPQKAVRV